MECERENERVSERHRVKRRDRHKATKNRDRERKINGMVKTESDLEEKLTDRTLIK